MAIGVLGYGVPHVAAAGSGNSGVESQGTLAGNLMDYRGLQAALPQPGQMRILRMPVGGGYRNGEAPETWTHWPSEQNANHAIPSL